MKVQYIKEGYFKDIDKIRSSADKKSSIRDTYGKIQVEYMISKIRFALFSLLYWQYQKDRSCYIDYNTYVGSYPLEIEYAIPNLRDDIAPPFEDDISCEDWNLKYHNYFNGKVSPIKSIEYINGEYVATVRLVKTGGLFSTTFYPGKFLEGFSKIERIVSKQADCNFKMKLVLLEDEVKNFMDYTYYEKSSKETEFPGDICNISLYNFDKESFKYLEDFINRFDSIRDDLNGLTLVSANIDSLSDVPSFQNSKFNYIKLERKKEDYEVYPKIRYHLKELGDYQKLLYNSGKTYTSPGGVYSIIIFPHSFEPSDVEMISNGAISAEKYLKYVDYKTPVSFNPYTGEDTSPDLCKSGKRY